MSGTPRRRRLLASLATILLVGELLAIGVQGTLAAYNGQATNSNSGSSVGTLTLVTRSPVLTGAMCLSSGGPVGIAASNNNTKCTPTVTIAGGPFKPGTTSSVTVVTINSGSVNAGDLSVWVPKASTCPTTFCKYLELTIQQTSSAGTAIQCYYPTTSTTCVAATTKTLKKFVTTYSTSLTKLRLTGGLPALSSRYFKIGLTFATATTPKTENKLQGKTAKFSLAWYVNQTGP